MRISGANALCVPRGEGLLHGRRVEHASQAILVVILVLLLLTFCPFYWGTGLSLLATAAAVGVSAGSAVADLVNPEKPITTGWPK